MNSHSKNISILFFTTAIALMLAFFCKITPQVNSIEIMGPHYSEQNSTALPIVSGSTDADELFWIKLNTVTGLPWLQSLRVKTWGCVNSISVDETERLSTNEDKGVCNDRKGLILKNTHTFLHSQNSWSFAGATDGSNEYGIMIDKDWRDPILISAVALLVLFVMGLSYTLLSQQNRSVRLTVTFLFASAFLLRFWTVFFRLPAQDALYSDMIGYFYRGLEMTAGNYNPNQNFQPLGFTFWSMLMRSLGGWELLNWLHVFASWGTVVVIFFLALEYFSITTALVATGIATVHMAQITFASFHMAECLYTFFLTLSLWWGAKCLRDDKLSAYFIFGFLLMLAFYFKGNHAFFIPIFCALILWKHHFSLEGIKRITLLGIGCLILAVPHLLWTKKVYGKAELGPTAGALNFIEGKCPWKNNQDSTGASWMSPLFSQTGENLEKKWDRPFTEQSYFWQQGVQCVKDNPAVMLSSFRYVYYLFFENELWPAAWHPNINDLYYQWRPFFYFFLLPLSALGFLLLAGKNNSLQTVLGVMFLSVCLTVYIFKSENRFRVPFDGVLILWGAYSFTWIIEKIYFILKVANSLQSKHTVQSPTSETLRNEL